MKRIFQTAQSDLKKYNGTWVEVGEELTDDERDSEVGKMYHITFEDGTKTDAFEDELLESNIINISCDVANVKEELKQIQKIITPKKEMKIFVFVRGGMVQSVMSNNANIEVEVLDFDTDDEDCLDELERIHKAVRSSWDYTTIY